MPKVDMASVPIRRGSGYPAPFGAPRADRKRQRLGQAGVLNAFGVNLMTSPPRVTFKALGPQPRRKRRARRLETLARKAPGSR